MNRLAGQIAIVSGVGSGMGAAHVRALAAEGARVLGFDIVQGTVSELIAEFGPDKFSFITADVSSEQDWQAVLATCIQHFGAPSVLVNNAGIVRANRVDTASEQEYRHVIDVNQVGTFLGMRAVVPHMKAQRRGSIINISSTAGLVGFEDNFAYVASKWAIRGMTRAAALELAEFGIRVNTVCPGETDTPLLRADPTAFPPESSRFGRWAQPSEIAAAVVFLASTDSSYISGTDVILDGTHTAA